MENSRQDETVIGTLRLNGEKIVPWIFHPEGAEADPKIVIDGTDMRPAKLGEAVQIVAEGTINFEGDEMPISIHMTVPIASAAMPVFGDPMLVHISRMYK